MVRPWTRLAVPHGALRDLQQYRFVVASRGPAWRGCELVTVDWFELSRRQHSRCYPTQIPASRASEEEHLATCQHKQPAQLQDLCHSRAGTARLQHARQSRRRPRSRLCRTQTWRLRFEVPQSLCPCGSLVRGCHHPRTPIGPTRVVMQLGHSNLDHLHLYCALCRCAGGWSLVPRWTRDKTGCPRTMCLFHAVGNWGVASRLI